MNVKGTSCAVHDISSVHNMILTEYLPHSACPHSLHVVVMSPPLLSVHFERPTLVQSIHSVIVVKVIIISEWDIRDVSVKQYRNTV